MFSKITSTPLLLLALLIMSALTLTACSGSNTPEEAMHAFYEAVEKNDPSVAVNLIYIPKSPDEKEAASSEIARNDQTAPGKASFLIASVHDQIIQHKGIKNIKTENVKYSEDKKSATMDITLEFKDGTTQKEPASLVLSDGKWLVIMR